jgi:hypothetical protein
VKSVLRIDMVISFGLRLEFMDAGAHRTAQDKSSP